MAYKCTIQKPVDEIQDPTLEQSPKVLKELIHFTGWIENCDPHLTNINQKAIGRSIKES